MKKSLVDNGSDPYREDVNPMSKIIPKSYCPLFSSSQSSSTLKLNIHNLGVERHLESYLVHLFNQP